jgi:hypothetical protein
MDPIRGLDTRSRRGVLLLVVLSMLTLFMMLGVSYVVVTTRARKSARAFANNVVAATSAGVAEQALLDQAFLTVVRGSAEPLTGTDQPASLGSGASGGESLLGDKYGSPTATATASTTVIGRLTAASPYQSPSNNAFIQLTTQSLTPTPANSSALAGRVITLSLPGLVASARVLQATGAAASPTIVIAAGPTVSGRQLSVTNITAALANVIGTGSNTVIINGREFAGTTGDTNEAWDGVDSRNPLLPGIQSEDTNGNGILDAGEDTNSNGSLDVRLVMASSTLGNGGSLPMVDNDSDGIADSRFVDIGLPPVVSPKGAVLLPRAAILVADLDGRLNLNVHGSGSDESTFDTAANRDRYPPVTAASGTTVPLYQLPRGLGVGPADVTLDRSLLFGSVPATNVLRVANATVAFSGVATAGGSSRDSVTSRFVPQVRNAEGRYGDTVGGKGTTFGNSVAPTTSAKPGVDGTNDAISVALDQWRCSLNGSNTALSYFTSPGRYASPPDLKGLLKVWVDNTGQPVYYRPFWTGDPATASVTARLSNETIDDPYEINLTRTAGRGDVRNPSSATAEPPDSLFTPAELEGLLRFGDSDTMKLPRRLAAILGTGASRGRLAVTTESWDTPAITGDAWQQVINGPFSVFLNATGSVFPRRPQDLFSPETLQGHRMNLNRPFHDAPNYTEPNDATGIARRQAFARQLYCLLVAIATRNGSTMTLPLAEQLAQYAINVVDFRDADSVMTQFPYDPSFGTANTGWSPGTNNIVWGCERPEILITETWAWHNRRTEDLAVGGKVVDMPTDTADDNFDQQRRPQGAFFVELFSPWSSSASRYDSSTVSPTDVVDPNTASKTLRGEPLPAEFADNEDGNGNGALDTGEDLNGNGELDMRTWRDSSLNLAKTAPSNSPIWRLVTVRGSNAFGTDPVVPSATNAALSILDPSRPGSSASIDRAFYFAQPSSAIQSSTPTNSCFWQQSSGGKSPNSQTYVVVGTDAPFNPLTSGTAAADVRVFRGASGQPATITEPLAASDPYDVMMQAASPGNTYTAPTAGNNYVGSWASPIDQPLDADRTPPAGITSAPLLLAGDPQLMKNGTHENFAVVHLQRLANPTQAWNATSNPYLTIDSMTVDLTVVNTDSTDVNRDEPGTTGATPLAYLAMQKHYGRGSSTTSPVSTERGGKLSQIAGPGAVRPAHDIWSAAVDAASTPIAADNAESFRTDMVNTRAATPITPGVTAGTLNASTITFNNAAAHTLQRTPERFYDTANSRPYSFAWLFWGNRPFVSATELALVPTASPFTLSRWHTLAQGLPRAFAHLAGYFESVTPVAPWDAVGGRTGAANAVNQTLWHFVHVPSPFAGLYATVPNSSPSSVNSAAMTALGLDIFPLGHLSSYREPGRINVNTIADQRVWRGLFGAVTDRGDKPDPTVAPVNELAAERLPGWTPTLFITTAGSQGTPCTSPLGFMQVLPQPGANTRPAQARAGGFLDNHINEDRNANGILDPSEDTNNNGLLDPGEDINSNGVIDPSEDDNGNGLLDRNDFRDTGRNAFFRYQTMNRITNNLTTRSNVFAIWVTIGYFDGNAPTVEVEPVRRNRAFFIFDRSIPVGYEPGKNHNVPDAVLLRRIIQ